MTAPDSFGSRIEIRSWLEDLGFKTRDAVTKKVDVLFVGPEHGRVKIEKALKYGIPIIPYQFPLALGFFSERTGSPLEPSRELHALTLFTLAHLDNIHAKYHLTGDERFRLASRLVDGVLQRLLLLSRGPVGARPSERGQGVAWFDNVDLTEILREIDEAWRLAIAFMEAGNDEA